MAKRSTLDTKGDHTLVDRGKGDSPESSPSIDYSVTKFIRYLNRFKRQSEMNDSDRKSEQGMGRDDLHLSARSRRRRTESSTTPRAALPFSPKRRESHADNIQTEVASHQSSAA
jgi:hypothetical protein